MYVRYSYLWNYGCELAGNLAEGKILEISVKFFRLFLAVGRVPAPSMYKTMDGFSTKLVTIFV